MKVNVYKNDLTVGQLTMSQNLSGLTNQVTDRDIILVYEGGRCTYIDQDGQKTQYGNLREAIGSVQTFSGNIRLEQDLHQEFQTSDLTSLTNSSLFTLWDRNLVFDLNEHTWTVHKNDDGDSRVCRFMLEAGDSQVAIRNGTLSCHGIQALWLYGGKFSVENANVYSNIRIDVRPAAMSTGLLYVDSMSKMTFTYDWCSMYNSGGTDNMAPGIWAFGADITSFQGWEDYKRTEGESGIYKFIEDYDGYMPTVFVEGTMISEMSPNEDPQKTCDLVFTNGSSNKMPVKYVVGKNAILQAFNGTALFINNCGKIILNGGRVYGRTPIILRSGTLSVSDDANPFVYGTGNGTYDPFIHAGNGTSMLNKLGNAVVLESVGGDYGKYDALDGERLPEGQYPKAAINSGEYYSLYSAPIGSYCHIKDERSYHSRLSAFMHGGILGKSPAQEEYIPRHGDNPDYGIIEDGYSTADICEIKKRGDD